MPLANISTPANPAGTFSADKTQIIDLTTPAIINTPDIQFIATHPQERQPPPLKNAMDSHLYYVFT